MTKEECRELEVKVRELNSKISEYYENEKVATRKSHECFIGKTYKYKDCDGRTNYYKIVWLDVNNNYRAYTLKFSYPYDFEIEYDEIFIEIVSLPLWCNSGLSNRPVEPTLKDLIEISLEEYNEAFDKSVAEIKSIEGCD